MTILLCFILGIAFYGLVMPVLESIVAYIATYFEYKKGKYTLKLMKMQNELECDCGKESTYAIGFDTSEGITLEDLEEEEEDDEDWEEENE